LESLAADILIALLLSLGQLIEPLSPEVINRLNSELNQSIALCKSRDELAEELRIHDCSALNKDESKADEFERLCQPIIDEEKKCRLDKKNLEVVNFIPASFDQVRLFDERQLFDELKNICLSVQDRSFLTREEWSSGEFYDREGILDQIVLLRSDTVETLLQEKILESTTRNFSGEDMASLSTALCKWSISYRSFKRTNFNLLSSRNFFESILDDLPDVSSLPVLEEANSILDKDGKFVMTLPNKVKANGIDLNINRQVEEVENFPPQLFNAFVAVEDKRFYEHKGFDFSSINRLIFLASSGQAQGGSTFTMQLVKNAFLLEENLNERSQGRRSLVRKIKELLLIPLIEQNYSKEEILAYYLNLIDLAKGAQGVKASSIDLFNKSNLKDLELHEMALLAALPKGTALYDPRRNPVRAKGRRDTVLNLMADQGYITQSLADEEKSKPIDIFVRAKAPEDEGYSYFYVNEVRRKINRLKSSGVYDLEIGGYDIKTPLDLQLQKITVKALQNGLRSYERRMGRFKYMPIIEDLGQVQIKLDYENVEKWSAEITRFNDSRPLPSKDQVYAVRLSEGWGFSDGTLIDYTEEQKDSFSESDLGNLCVVEYIVSEDVDAADTLVKIEFLNNVTEGQKQQFNLTNTVAKYEGDWLQALKVYLNQLSYHDTNWILALKLNGKWGLEDGREVSVNTRDRRLFDGMRTYDVVALNPNNYTLNSPTDVQGAAVVINIETGHVIAMSGGFSTNQSKYFGLNRATRSYKQPGSTVKPITYLYALNNGLSPRSVVSNYRTIFPPIDSINGYEHCRYSWSPENAGGGGTGSVSLANALRLSMNRALVGTFLASANVPFVQGVNNYFNYDENVLEDLVQTHEDIFSLGHEMGIYRSLSVIDKVQYLKRPCFSAMIGSYETTPFNMAQGYATIASGGLVRKGTFLQEIKKGNEVLKADESRVILSNYNNFHRSVENGTLFAPQAFNMLSGVSPESVDDLKILLSEVVKSGTARGLPDAWNGKVAGKTGTTNDSVDTWFTGFNNKIAIAVWVGYDDKSGAYKDLGSGNYGSNVAMPVFKEIMEEFYKLNPNELDENL